MHTDHQGASRQGHARPASPAAPGPGLIELARALGQVRHEFGRDLPLQTLRVFIDIAINPGTHMTAIAVRLALGKSSTCRSISALTAHTWRGQRGPALVEVQDDPDEGRIRRLHLTSRGEALAMRLNAPVRAEG
ncbi:MAG TPA: hypothetical protein DCY89_03825 [Gammaproteobacteria bacterium]|nr:hypothetical protein [Gammaproteobacteria bacterium]